MDLGSDDIRHALARQVSHGRTDSTRDLRVDELRIRGGTVSKLWTTYKLADGDLIHGEYSFVTDEEYFDDLDEPLDVIAETWQLVESRTITFKPSWWDEREVEDVESPEALP